MRLRREGGETLRADTVAALRKRRRGEARVRHPQTGRYTRGHSGRAVRAGLDVILIGMDRETKFTANEGRYLLVRAGDSLCAIPAPGVRRVVRNLPCHPFPGGQPHFVGFSQFGGEPLAVIDLHTLITGEEARIHRGATVILGRGSRGGRTVIGLAVDEALRVVMFADHGAESRSGGMVESTRTLGGESVSVLDTSLLLDDRLTGTEAPHG